MPLLTHPLKKSTIIRRIREGCGSGSYENYMSFLNRRDFYRVCDQLFFWPKMNRPVTLIGRSRAQYFFNRIFTDRFQILDAHEFPLIPTEETLAVAESLSLHHPINSEKQLIPLCPDFAFYLKSPQGECPEIINLASDDMIKRIQNGDPPRSFTQYALMILAEYFNRKQIPCQLVSDSDINPIRIRNIQRILASFRPDLIFPEEILSWFQHAYETTCDSAVFLSEQCCQTFHLSPGMGINVFYRLIWLDRIHPDLDSRPLFLTEDRKPPDPAAAIKLPQIPPPDPQETLYSGSLWSVSADLAPSSSILIPSGVFRILFSDQQNIYWISLTGGIEFPHPLPVNTLKDLRRQGLCLPVKEAPILLNPPEDPKDNVYLWARSLASYPLPRLLKSRSFRLQAIRETSRKMNVHPNTVKRYFCDWWRGGMTLFALMSSRKELCESERSSNEKHP